ncbi:MAG TPA: zinc-dependent alcohol dehydrogenase family protein [Candidatus Methylomirabilis sp.]|jgi:alcohol dehydrogenase|nr:zinc-dependent alcohol dehydrogenase family protein [Candidatus Methylomirabilis sp.]
MKTTSAVLYEMEKPPPYAESKPLVVEELELEGPGPGEVLVEIAAAGLCHSDLSVMNGSRPRPLPMVLGHEASGVVAEVGTSVEGLKAGDRVVFSFVPMCGRCTPCAVGRPALCERGGQANGRGTLLSGARRFKSRRGEPLHHHLGVSAFSRYTVAAQESLIPIPSEVPLEKAALFGCAVMTGVGAVVNTARVEPGARVAVFGLGGVGLAVVLGAQLAGALQIVALDLLPTKLDLARRLGATHTVSAGAANAVEAVREITRGGADYTFEAVGNAKVLGQAYAATRRGGKTIAIGLPHPAHRLDLQAVSLVAEERSLLGSYMGSAVPRRDLPRFLDLYLAGRLPVDELVSQRVELGSVNAAFDALREGVVVRQLVCF